MDAGEILGTQNLSAGSFYIYDFRRNFGNRWQFPNGAYNFFVIKIALYFFFVLNRVFPSVWIVWIPPHRR